MSELLVECVEQLRQALATAPLMGKAARAARRRILRDSAPVEAASGRGSPTAPSWVAEGWLGAAIEAMSDEFTALASALRRAEALLHWHYSYPAAAGSDERPRYIGFCELVGPRGPFPSQAARLGLTLLAPRTFYPAHRHPAEELYLILSGQAVWAAGAEIGLRQSGDAVFHTSNLPHDMTTRDFPMLAAYGWTGNVLAPSVYLEHESSASR